MNQTMNKTLGSALLITLLALAGCGKNAGVGGTAGEAEVATQKANEAMTQELNLADPQDFEDAKRGFIAAPEGKIMAADGTTVLIDFDAYKFVDGKPPATVNPSLWRHATLKGVGLFKVRDGVHQLRGFDIANITLIEGKTGWIVVDALTARESSAAAMAFARKHLGNKPVTALVFTHSHADHFGGALGVVTPQEVAERKIPVIASEGFMEEATSENILVGTAMARRSMYQFGKNLPPGRRAMWTPAWARTWSYGAIGILEPTQLITKPTQELVLDGVRFVFHNVPGAEAPAEMTFSCPRTRSTAAPRTWHRPCTTCCRCAAPRRATRCAGPPTCSRRWTSSVTPRSTSASTTGRSGAARIREFITKHRDVYKYTHDQTVRLINAGHTPREIADLIKLPKSLGVLPQHARLLRRPAPQRQGGLPVLPGRLRRQPGQPEPAAAAGICQALPGAAGRRRQGRGAAQAAYDKGDFRWAAELLNHAVFGDPDNKAAKELLARTYDQMGYMAEAATWRNSYLTAATGAAQWPAEEGYGPLGPDRHAVPHADRALPGSHGRRPERPRRRGQGPQGQPGADRPEDLVRAVDRERGAALQEGAAGRRAPTPP
jgi:alkyl sulfatase BDS1-like metallo-beta-lactamase superfamily hydrolase